jgi:hypothetical protein
MLTSSGFEEDYHFYGQKFFLHHDGPSTAQHLAPKQPEGAGEDRKT